jgi:hypothetical protein
MQTIVEGNGVIAIPGRSILSISGIKMLPYFLKFGSIWKIPYRGSLVQSIRYLLVSRCDREALLPEG